MRRHTPLVVALVVTSAASILIPTQTVVASHATDATEIDPAAYGRYGGLTYESKGEHSGHLNVSHSVGYELTEHDSIVVGPGGVISQTTAHTGNLGSDQGFRVTTNETLGFSVDPPKNHRAAWTVNLDYQEGLYFDGPLAGDELQQNDLALAVGNTDGGLAGFSDVSPDYGSETIEGATNEETAYTAYAWSTRGGSPIEIRISVRYTHP